MYQKVRIRLTALFSAVTCSLLLAALAVSFIASEKAQYSLLLSHFTRQAVTLLEEVNERSVLTTDWMASKEKSGSFHLFMTVQGVPAFHNSRHSSRLQSLFEEFSSGLPSQSEEPEASEASETFSLRVKQISENPAIYAGYHFLLPSALLYQEQIVKNDSILHIFVLQTLDTLYEKARSSLLFYMLIFIPAACFLTAFCWYFTGRLLRPLLESQKSQNRFLSAASHELRTPLAVILANASACRKAPPENQPAFFDVIDREGSQMSAMLEQLLTLSRADGHGLTMQMAPTDLQTLLLDVYESFLPLAKVSRHILNIRLPEQDLTLCICDGSRIGQVCRILLHNALSYTPAGSCILLSLSFNEKWFEISVQDNGPGIPDAEKEHIFERFYRCPQQNSKKGHHGLGLAVAREIALAHNASLSVHDAPDGGAVFVLRCPVSFATP